MLPSAVRGMVCVGVTALVLSDHCRDTETTVCVIAELQS